ncbi:thermonuclease family protein [Brachyspira sp.]|uniref:thermonuclease family protein n=1 Tax=Brachyspira sp. TaxID=1977261 RepID=UPI003D7D8909
MKKIIIIILFIFLIRFFNSNLEAQNNYSDYTQLKVLTNVQVIRVYDGDTFFVNIPYLHWLIGSNISVRIRGIDTAEIRGGTAETKALAQKSKDALIKLFENRTITLYNLNRDKYFRILADVKADNIEVKEYMIKNGFAKEYDGGTKSSW